MYIVYLEVFGYIPLLKLFTHDGYLNYELKRQRIASITIENTGLLNLGLYLE